ncbi:CDP-alcohol phosphatidyltransferase family protein [Brevibacterium daeguense]|uniref:CDP-alcohol phosphatidyltransferase family protein n=1 Tax=Brevibacterium daeguense TaxID=909936 RepID=A0ABP8EJZ6_9MICO
MAEHPESSPGPEAPASSAGRAHPPALGGKPEQRSDNWFNVPNTISVVRLVVLVPVVIWLMSQPEQRIAATIALAIFGGTDWIDGFWARKFGQVTRLGEILDPVADRLGIVIICVAMSWFGILPLWMLAVIMLTDVGLGIIGVIRLDATVRSTVSWLGKSRTALIMVGLPVLLLSTDSRLQDTPLDAIGIFLLSAGCVLHVAAGIDYAQRLLRAPRSAGRRASPQA